MPGRKVGRQKLKRSKDGEGEKWGKRMSAGEAWKDATERKKEARMDERRRRSGEERCTRQAAGERTCLARRGRETKS